jgi:hypothetical protein
MEFPGDFKGLGPYFKGLGPISRVYNLKRSGSKAYGGNLKDAREVAPAGKVLRPCLGMRKLAKSQAFKAWIKEESQCSWTLSERQKKGRRLIGSDLFLIMSKGLLGPKCIFCDYYYSEFRLFMSRANN